jgi:hypothetical protein
MDWLVTGTRGGKPGRWKLEAADESAARQKAVAGGVSVQEVRRYPAAQVGAAAAAAVAPPSAAAALEHSEPEASDDEPPPDGGHAALADDETPAHEEGVQEEPAGLMPAPDETLEAPTAKPAQSAASTSKPKSIWGMAAIAAGVLAAVAGFIAPARVAAVPLASAGLLLAALGIYLALKRKRSGLLLPAIGIIVCAAAIGLVVYTGLQKGHAQEAPAPTVEELQDRARADRIAHSNIQVQFISIRPAEKGKYDLTFAYKCLAGMATGINGRLLINDANGKEITTLAVFQSFPQGLGTDAVRRENRWALDDATAQPLQGDASQLKVQFDPD